jgi:uncharacterized protein YjdB
LSNVTLNVPSGTQSAYQAADVWKDFSIEERSNTTVAVTDVTVQPSAISLPVGKTLQLTVTVLPDNATNKSVIWATDNADVATVTDGWVTGIAEGTTVVRVFTVEGSKTAACSVKVINNQANEPEAGGSYVFVDNGKLTVSTPAAEQIFIYTVGGALLRQVQKAAGEATFDLNGLPKGVLIIRGSSGWARKAVF